MELIFEDFTNDCNHPIFCWRTDNDETIAKPTKMVQSHVIIGTYNLVGINNCKMALVVHIPNNTIHPSLDYLTTEELVTEIATLSYDCSKHDGVCFEGVNAIMLLQIVPIIPVKNINYDVQVMLWFDNTLIQQMSSNDLANSTLFNDTEGSTIEPPVNIHNVPEWKHKFCTCILSSYSLFHILDTILNSALSDIYSSDSNIGTMYSLDFTTEQTCKILNWYNGDDTGIKTCVSDIVYHLRSVNDDTEKISEMINILISDRGILVI